MNCRRQVAERTFELRRSNENLQQFASIASHDLQEPLRKLRLFASVLLRYKEQLPDEAKELLSKIHLTSERMSQLIREILQYSKISYGIKDFVAADLDAILQVVLTDLDLQIKETGALIDYPGSLPRIQAIPRQIHQLFYNLLTNALKFRKEGVTPVIRIMTRTVLPEEIQANPALKHDREYLQIIISDNGIGFDRQFAEQIFQIFERLHSTEEFEGTGVGLALCKKIAENHQGHIFAISTPGQGAAFHLLLPFGQSQDTQENN